MTSVRVEWDYDVDEGVPPPAVVAVPSHLDGDALEDYLSNEYGWLVRSWEWD